MQGKAHQKLTFSCNDNFASYKLKKIVWKPELLQLNKVISISDVQTPIKFLAQRFEEMLPWQLD